jgi:hypothetical protein
MHSTTIKYACLSGHYIVSVFLPLLHIVLDAAKPVSTLGTHYNFFKLSCHVFGVLLFFTVESAAFS